MQVSYSQCPSVRPSVTCSCFDFDISYLFGLLVIYWLFMPPVVDIWFCDVMMFLPSNGCRFVLLNSPGGSALQWGMVWCAWCRLLDIFSSAFSDLSSVCPCGETQTMSHIVESCPLTKLNGGLSRLHSADEDALLWLSCYGSWHAYKKKKSDLGHLLFNLLNFCAHVVRRVAWSFFLWKPLGIARVVFYIG